jgi:hypothetical protein
VITLSPETCTFVFEIGESAEYLTSKLAQFRKDHDRFNPLVVLFEDRPHLSAAPAFIQNSTVVRLKNWRDLPGIIPTRFLAYLPSKAPFSAISAERMVLDDRSITPWIPVFHLSGTEGARLSLLEAGWIGPVDLLRTVRGSETSLTLQSVETLLENSGLSFQYQACPGGAAPSPVSGVAPKISKTSSVLAIVPHFNCHGYLEQALRSLVEQSRPLDGIVVVDDRSDVLPVDIVKKFKNVTLLRSSANVGPYRLIQSVMDQTGYDAYLFQDADDWSAADRLELLLGEAERTGAELIGSQEILFFGDSICPNHYPLDVHGALAQGPSYAMLHPSSLVSRELVLRAGGYPTGLRFSGDLEFLNRAVHAGRLANLDAFAYFRRMRTGSLTLSPKTGLTSPARMELHRLIRTRVWENLKKVSAGLQPDLTPLRSAEAASLEWVTGPRLRDA